MKLTIGVPVYNCQDDIAKNIERIKQEFIGYTDIEVLISDNASTDDSVDIIKDSIKGDNRFRLIENKENQGMDKNVLSILNSANGEFVHILSADDWYTVGGGKCLVEIIRQYTDLELIVLSNNYLNVFSNEIIQMSDKYDDSYCDNANDFFEKEQYKLLCISNFVVRRSSYKQIDATKCIGTLWPHLFITKELMKNNTKSYIFSFTHPIISVQLGNQGWVNKDAIKTYLRAFYMYEDMAKNLCCKTWNPQIFINSVINPRTQKCESFSDNIQVSIEMLSIYKKYYKPYFFKYTKFCIILLFLRKKNFFQHLKK